MLTIQEFLRYSGGIYLTNILCNALHKNMSTDKFIPSYIKKLLDFEPDKSKKSDGIIYLSEYYHSENNLNLSLHSISKKDLMSEGFSKLAYYPNLLIIFDLNEFLQREIYDSDLFKKNVDYFAEEILKKLYFWSKGITDNREEYNGYRFNSTFQFIELKNLQDVINKKLD